MALAFRRPGRVDYTKGNLGSIFFGSVILARLSCRFQVPRPPIYPLPFLFMSLVQPDMALAMEVWSHMKTQGVHPTPEEHVDMIKGWVAAGELRQRVSDGSVEAFLGKLADMAFELGPSREAAAAASSGELSGAGGEEGMDSRVRAAALVRYKQAGARE